LRQFCRIRDDKKRSLRLLFVAPVRRLDQYFIKSAIGGRALSKSLSLATSAVSFDGARLSSILAVKRTVAFSAAPS